MTARSTVLHTQRSEQALDGSLKMATHYFTDETEQTEIPVGLSVPTMEAPACEIQSTDFSFSVTKGTYIPATQRPDGTWRKARRVRDGYVPQEEVPLYESKGKKWAKNQPGLPPGLHYREEVADNSTNRTIPGLTPAEPVAVSKSAKKKKKKKQQQAVQEHNDDVNHSTGQQVIDLLEKMTLTPLANDSVATNSCGKTLKGKGMQPTATDPAKRIKNLKKKLREIETLKEKIQSGKLINPEKDQLEKIERQAELEAEIEELEGL